MTDAQGRRIEYLRLSVTERCTLRCAYCRAGDGECPKKSELSPAEYERFVQAAASLGINKVRITGGEPMLRKDIIDIVRRIASVDGIGEISMTTNAQQMNSREGELKAAGLSRLNISLDSLIKERYARITGGGDLSDVFRCIDRALDAGLTPVKLNIVPMRGVNDDEIDDFIALAKDRPLHVRFIELMPLGPEKDALRVPSDEITSERPYLIKVEKEYAAQPSEDYRIDGYKGRIGFISPVSHSFCASCNRIRLLSDGTLRTCLGDNTEIKLDMNDGKLESILAHAIYNKPCAHTFGCGFSTGRNMNEIGG